MLTENEARSWIEEVTNDFIEIGYTSKEATGLAWAKYEELSPHQKWKFLGVDSTTKP